MKEQQAERIMNIYCLEICPSSGQCSGEDCCEVYLHGIKQLKADVIGHINEKETATVEIGSITEVLNAIKDATGRSWQTVKTIDVGWDGRSVPRVVVTY